MTAPPHERMYPLLLEFFTEELLRRLLDASDAAIEREIQNAEHRVNNNQTPGARWEKLQSSQKSMEGTAALATEFLSSGFFYKGKRSEFPYQIYFNRLLTVMEEGMPITMVISALPWKFPSPVQAFEGGHLDVGELSFLLRLRELAKGLDRLYRSGVPEVRDSTKPLAIIDILHDGKFWNSFLQAVKDSDVEKYNEEIKLAVGLMGLGDIIQVDDLQVRIETLDCEIYSMWLRQRNLYIQLFEEKFGHLFKPSNIKEAIKLAVDFGKSLNSENLDRFQGYFASLVYGSKDWRLFPKFKEVAAQCGMSKNQLYARTMETLQTPQEGILEELRQEILHEGWRLSIIYLATRMAAPLLAPVYKPYHFRLTVLRTSEPGVFSVQTGDQEDISIQPWSGVGLLESRGGRGEQWRINTVRWHRLLDEKRKHVPTSLVEAEEYSDDGNANVPFLISGQFDLACHIISDTSRDEHTHKSFIEGSRIARKRVEDAKKLFISSTGSLKRHQLFAWVESEEIRTGTCSSEHDEVKVGHKIPWGDIITRLVRKRH